MWSKPLGCSVRSLWLLDDGCICGSETGGKMMRFKKDSRVMFMENCIGSKGS